MQTIPLSFSFKGKRNYVHGTDVYNNVVSNFEKRYEAEKITFLRLKFRNLASHQCVFHLADKGEKPAFPENIFAEVFIKVSVGSFMGYIEETDDPITARYAYDEDRIHSICEIKNDSQVIIPDKINYTPIEVAVSMTKFLHHKLYPPGKSKWLFSQLELKRLFKSNDIGNYTIQLKHNLKNILTKSLIYNEHEEIGYIYFSLMEKMP